MPLLPSFYAKVDTKTNPDGYSASHEHPASACTANSLVSMYNHLSVRLVTDSSEREAKKSGASTHPVSLLISPGEGGKGEDYQELADSHPLFPAQPPACWFSLEMCFYSALLVK